MTQDSPLTHQDGEGRVRMVDIGDKPVTARRALAGCQVLMNVEAFHAVIKGAGPKGDPRQAAELAGIMAAKKTADLIPLCHPLPLRQAKVSVEALDDETGFEIRAEIATDGKTGVEMEALTAASIAALTLYDMVKAVDKAMVISALRLLEKSGGRSGDYSADDFQAAP